ncbi:putative ATP-binding cassette protein subfamily C,member 5 [Leishmania major strain Friedlin]|uniref:Putative ATP-binding cassette protein subfamily C,member 5 n=1 Tax=Leishmania major TaxID=5664 RepID=Q4Q6D5_LEIMA|nr:putative ATP-binding cassette protein subfamily C,member 5 [Leishmania major strain Friedlin]CAG9579293.1 pentamidine_resistance_protein_1/ABCC5 [Leishmania major strain Friedlin]CAJ08315.1 putative ATP-binding cassette protein subfamily C,member 5 [Leishmania major strain Friedlin]|eukprot:XP_001685113.1 putative ATP-binding cassette protein subfamily C,member 5 [Leishmania major strain Friedlin]
MHALYGAEPAYEKQPEDRASWIFGSLFYTWLGDLMQRAAREELTMDGLPRPMREYRAYNAGVVLSAELQRQRARRHAWDGYVGTRVGVRWDDASDGVLRWVGAVQQYGTPGRLYAGVEWRVAPSRRRGCCARRCMGWLLRRGRSAPVPERGPGAYHRGEVDGEHLFDPVEDDTVLTCERVEDVILWGDGPGGETQEAATTGEDSVDDSDISSQRQPEQSGVVVAAPPTCMSVTVALFRVLRWRLLLLGPLRLTVEVSALLTPMALSWYIRLLQGNADTPSSDTAGSDTSSAAASSLPSSSFVDSGSMMGALWQPVASVALLFAISLVRSLALQKYAQVAYRSAYAMRSGLSSCIAAKCLRIASRELRRPELNPGRIVNIMTTDVASIEDTLHVLWMAVTVPLQVCAAVSMLYRSIGWAACISILMLLFFLPIQVLLTKMTYASTVGLAKSSDARLRTTNEFLSGIRTIKFMSLEDTFEEEINARRAAELRAVRRYQIISTANLLISQCVPSCTTAAVMVAYYRKGYPMSPDIIYPALSLLSLMDTPFELVTTLVGVFSQFLVSMKRLTSFLAADDAQARDILEAALASKEGDDAAAVLCNATVSSYKAVPLPPASSRESGGGETHYELRAKTLLADVDLRVPRGRLTVVLGPTGSGKSTLLNALIGALAVTRGRVACSRSVAYVPQQPWIMGATLRDNVVFFGAPDAAAFERAVRSSQLASDLALLADGAETEIGENGINLSGGQKARVSLARAVYADRDVYVLDDPLSALDAQVGERVMRECVCGALAGKTRVLATHQVSAAAYADLVVLLEEGRVAFQGSYAAYCQYARVHYERSLSGMGKTSVYAAQTVCELASAVDLSKLEDILDENAEVQRPLTESTLESSGGVLFAAEPQAHRVLGDTVTEDSPDVTVVESGEEKAVGAVPWVVYRRYIEACGGLLTLCRILIFFVFTEGVSRSGDVWLSLWSGGKLESLSTHLRLSVYVAAVLAAILVPPSRDLWCFTITRRAAYHIHAGLLRSLARARLSFFDVTPRGRLINRMSRDMGLIDWDLSVSVDILLFFFFYLMAYFAIMTTSQPFVLVLLLPCISVYGHIFRFFCAANREMQRLLNISNSPVFSILNEVVTGRWTICTYGREQDMMREVLRRLDGVFACSYMRCMGNRWLSVRVELLGNVTVSGLALLGVLAMKLPWMHMNLGLLALSITKASSITMVLSSFIRIGASVEASMNCVERVLYYTDNAPAEDIGIGESAMEACDSTALSVVAGDGESAAAAAPAGSLVLEHVDMRYRPGLPLVLRDVCFAVAPGQKVGVVGRTGSGKSTLLLAFLRLVEVCGGRMLVCGRDARDYGVRELRGLFSMIPQDPLLFDGTVRSNVDPFGRCGDAAVWRALRQVGMEERVRGEAGGLDGRVQEGGANYSVGQRQLLCLARALLKRGSAFLLMDEATANVDPALDRQIQRTVQHTFRDYTVVTIAHRLHTVAACDVIFVMDQGRVLEFGSPRELVERQGSAFGALVGSLSKGAQQAFRLALEGLSDKPSV